MPNYLHTLYFYTFLNCTLYHFNKVFGTKQNYYILSLYIKPNQRCMVIHQRQTMCTLPTSVAGTEFPRGGSQGAPAPRSLPLPLRGRGQGDRASERNLEEQRLKRTTNRFLYKLLYTCTLYIVHCQLSTKE